MKKEILLYILIAISVQVTAMYIYDNHFKKVGA